MIISSAELRFGARNKARSLQ